MVSAHYIVVLAHYIAVLAHYIVVSAHYIAVLANILEKEAQIILLIPTPANGTKICRISSYKTLHRAGRQSISCFMVT